MKQLTCEMCGGTDIVKQDGMYICQTCGTKYSVEDAKKMMVEGTVEVAGTVKVDNTASVANYLVMAENAYDADNKKETETYCNKIIEIDPTNYEAWLLKGRAAGWQSTLGNLRIEEAINCFSKALENAPEDEKEEIQDEASDEVTELSLALVRMSCENYAKDGSVYNANSLKKNVQAVLIYCASFLLKCGVGTEEVFNCDLRIMVQDAISKAVEKVKDNYLGPDKHPTKYAWDRFKEEMYALCDMQEFSIKIYKSDGNIDITCYKNIIGFLGIIRDSYYCTYSQNGWLKHGFSKEEKEEINDKIMEYHNKIKEIDSNYTIPERPQETSGGCYVATAVYGSYDCPQVWTLRRYRDDTLASTWYGRAFIYIYYAISPTLVKWFGDTNWFKNMWKGKLDRMVANLQAGGVEDTPYEDKNWR